MHPRKRRFWHKFEKLKLNQIVMLHLSRLSLSIASTAAVALATLPFAVSPASAQALVAPPRLRAEVQQRISKAIASFCAQIPALPICK